MLGQRHVYSSPIGTPEDVPPRVAISVLSWRLEARRIEPPRCRRTVGGNHRMGECAVAHTVWPPGAAVDSSTQVIGHKRSKRETRVNLEDAGDLPSAYQCVQETATIEQLFPGSERQVVHC